jgi:hypothetical protein
MLLVGSQGGKVVWGGGESKEAFDKQYSNPGRGKGTDLVGKETCRTWCV